MVAGGNGSRIWFRHGARDVAGRPSTRSRAMDPDAQLRRNDSVAEVTATLTCPVCRHSAVEVMPTDRCVFFYECLS